MLDILLEDMKKTLDDFYRITGMQISLYDEKLISIYHAKGSNPLCSQYKKHPATACQCARCEEEGIRICNETGKTHMFRCHAGLMEANIPICENGVIIGYMITGQILCSDNVEYTKAKAAEYEKLCQLDTSAFTSLLEKQPIVEHSYLQAAVNMIEMCASYLYLSRIIRRKSLLLSAQLRDYVDNHFTEALSVQLLCDKLYISRAKLYTLSLDAFGMGCSEYILKKRMEKARQLLATSDKSIYLIAEESGFHDNNYFTRIFKKTMGMTPGQYRKANHRP